MGDRSASFRQTQLEIQLLDDLREYLREADNLGGGGGGCDPLARIAEGVGGWANIRCPACRRRKFARERRRAALGYRDRDRLGRSQTRVREALSAADWSVERARDLIDYLDDTGCKQCCGTGRVVVRVTDVMRNDPRIERFPTGSSKHGKPPDTTSSSDKLERMGKIGNLLVTMAARDPVGASALKAWAVLARSGMVCLFEFTDAGRMLLRYRTAEDRREPLRVFVDEQRRRDGGYTDHQRDRLFERAEAEARDLFDCVVLLWNELVAGHRADLEKRKLRAAREEASALLRGCRDDA